MATADFSRSAKADLLSIGAYTLQTWGPSQAERYLDSLEHCAKLLAGNPSLGRHCDWIRPGLHRFEKGRHVLLYRRQENGILVSRILHQNMLPDQQHFEDDPDLEWPRHNGN
jgi:toxin ParE1/3/4